MTWREQRRIRWPGTIAGAQSVQNMLAGRVVIAPLSKPVRSVAGIDAAFSESRVFAAACLYSYPELALVDQSCASIALTFPYVPGYLSFREGPAIIGAFRKLTRAPDLILFDGHGIAHPRGLGIASHIGVLLNIPTIGCAKTRLVGNFTEPGITKGNRAPLRYRGKTVGVVLRTRDQVNPVFVSPGHRITVVDAANTVLACTDRYRIPEPLRCADMLSKQVAKDCPSLE